jgi:hypothetical protein
MDASNPIGFRLFQDEPSTPKRFYLQELEDLTDSDKTNDLPQTK